MESFTTKFTADIPCETSTLTSNTHLRCCVSLYAMATESYILYGSSGCVGCRKFMSELPSRAGLLGRW